MASQYFIESVSCDDDDEEDEEEEDDKDEVLDDFWDDSEDNCDVDLSVYAACDHMRDHMDDEATRKSFQKGIKQLEERYEKSRRPAESLKYIRKPDAVVSVGGAANGAIANKRRIIGGKRRKKQHTKLGNIAAIFSRVATKSTHGTAATKSITKRVAYATCANGFCAERVKPGSLWCQKHARKKQRRRNSAVIQQEVQALGKRRKKLAALLPVFEEKKMLMSFAFTAPGPNTCVRCGLPNLLGVMVCEKHKRLSELRSAAGVNTKATVEAALAVLDKKLRSLQQAANTPTHKRPRSPTSHENALTRHHCLHCQHRWMVPVGTIVDECPKCGDGNLN